MSQQHKKWLDLVEQRLDEKSWSRSDLAIVIGVSPAMITKLLKTGQGSDELKLQVNRKLNISESWVNFKER
ncbi:transcriptional regulator [Streptococcus anginosus]|uniref:transcriptional regulator n=1 Tax=Streptococcus anginosus TaxID=1328 RepID=UPI0035666D18